MKINKQTLPAIIFYFVVVLVCAGIYYFSYYKPNNALKAGTDSGSLTTISPSASTEVMSEATAAVSPTEEMQTVTVHVVGAVNNPGVYTLDGHSRVVDAVKAAGGFSADANEESVNLAGFVFDSQQIKIFRTGEEITPVQTPGNLNSPSQNTGTNDGLVNINTAAKSELMTLPSIGDVRAEAILSYRSANGAFNSIDEIKKVSGIGDGIFNNIKHLLTIE